MNTIPNYLIRPDIIILQIMLLGLWSQWPGQLQKSPTVSRSARDKSRLMISFWFNIKKYMQTAIKSCWDCQSTASSGLECLAKANEGFCQTANYFKRVNKLQIRTDRKKKKKTSKNLPEMSLIFVSWMLSKVGILPVQLQQWSSQCLNQCHLYVKHKGRL